MKKTTRRLRNHYNRRKAEKSFWDQRDIQRYVYQNNRCAYCRKKLIGSTQIDHVRPISHSAKKSVNYFHNLVIVCPSCNRLKLDKQVEYPDWIKRRKHILRKKKTYQELKRLAEVMK